MEKPAASGVHEGDVSIALRDVRPSRANDSFGLGVGCTFWFVSPSKPDFRVREKYEQPNRVIRSVVSPGVGRGSGLAAFPVLLRALRAHIVDYNE